MTGKTARTHEITRETYNALEAGLRTVETDLRAIVNVLGPAYDKEDPVVMGIPRAHIAALREAVWGCQVVREKLREPK